MDEYLDKVKLITGGKMKEKFEFQAYHAGQYYSRWNPKKEEKPEEN